MTEPGMPVDAVSEPEPGPRRRGPVAFGALLVGVGVALLLAQTGALPPEWRRSVWPVLLMSFGGVRLLQVTRHGREGLFFVVAGAWWLAGIYGWLSLPDTWPVLVVGLGASIVLQAMTTPPRDTALPFGRRHSGAVPWILVAIIVGAVLSNGRNHPFTPVLARDDGASVVAVAGQAERDIVGRGPAKSDLVAVMGKSLLDLSQATVGPGETFRVEVLTVMGRSVIRVPDHWIVDVDAVATAGSIRDVREYLRPAAGDTPPAESEPQPAPRVVVDGLVMMGSLIITS